jgi:single-strand DNA-binding protein
MAGHNSITIVGNLGCDPERRTTQSGKAVVNFSVGVTERKDTPTVWFNVVAWEKLADICAQYLHKGDAVLIAGRMTSRKYEKDGQQREAWNLVAQTMQMLGSRSDQPAQTKQCDLADDENGLPF